MQPVYPWQKIHYTLRIAVAMCFIGHGAFGIITKPVWCNYFAVFGIDSQTAYRLMPILGGIDILIGIVMLFYPVRAIAGWLVTWGLITAALRPLSGEPFAEMVERAGNYGAPLAFLILTTGEYSGIGNWLGKVQPGYNPGPVNQKRLTLCLRIVAFLLLLGHGWLNILGKKGLIDQYSSLGFADPVMTASIAGLLETMAACAILVRPFRSLLLVVFFWKMATELFYPHWEVFEWVERGGSYGSLLALLLMTRPKTASYLSLAT